MDWRPLEALSKFRNEVEHYRFSGNRDELAESIAGSAKVIRQLVLDVLGGDPLQLLGRPCWEAMLEIESVYDAELAKCRATLKLIEWYSRSVAGNLDDLSCSGCGSGLIGQLDPANTDQSRADFQCGSCGAVHCSEEVIENAIGQILYADYYIAMTDGGEDPAVECQNCEAETYILAEELCAACGHTIPIRTCGDCEMPVGEEALLRHGGRCVPCFLAVEMAHR